MAINTYPAVASPVKSVQRGSAAGAGTVTITSVDINKSFVNIQGTVGSGTVSASFNMSMNAGSFTQLGAGRSTVVNVNAYDQRRPSGSDSTVGSVYDPGGASKAFWTKATTVNSGNASVGAGSNNLVAGVVQGYLSNATSLVVSGACRWEVVEYN